MSREEKSSYRPGHRRKDLGRGRDGIMSEGRWAWVRVAIGQFVVLADEDEEIGQTIRLYHPKRVGPPLDLNLTACTEEELLVLKQLIDSAFEWALPEVQRRDKEAADAFAAGDDSHARVYRQAPQLVYRKRPVGEYGKGVPERPARVHEGGGGVQDSDGGLRGSGSGVAEQHAPGDGPKDDWPTPHVPPKL